MMDGLGNLTMHMDSSSPSSHPIRTIEPITQATINTTVAIANSAMPMFSVESRMIPNASATLRVALEMAEVTMLSCKSVTVH